MQTSNNFILIGIAGLARSGKDTFCKIASSILTEQGYEIRKLAFADELKRLADGVCKELFGISSWTDNSEEKKVIRPGLVWIGCGLREHVDPDIWIKKVNEQLEYEYRKYEMTGKTKKKVFLVSDVRFPNESDWIHNKWNGWVLHLSKFYKTVGFQGEIEMIFDAAPNSEEEKNDPIVKEKSDYKLQWEDIRYTSPEIKLSEIHNDKYLINTVRLCLEQYKYIKFNNTTVIN